ncbi:MAG: GatB/YqeY domain-containing protein [Anaerolineales bacterium]|jgi:uncharacterized protein YqeY
MLNKDKLQADLHEAMRSKDQVRKRTLRMVLTAAKLVEVERRAPLDEPSLLAVLQKEVKTRLETIEEAERADRHDLIPDLRAEIDVLQSYLPKPLTEEELKALALDAIAEAGVSEPREMGKVMRVLMPKIQGRADGKAASNLVRELLSAE